jgi:hypothetical protein
LSVSTDEEEERFGSCDDTHIMTLVLSSPESTRIDPYEP